MIERIDSPLATERLGGRLYTVLPESAVVYLRGELGMGKTTLVRGLLREAGYSGVVKSPTYTLVEEYLLNKRAVFHFDLYRLKDPEELEWIGFSDYVNSSALCLIEWPEMGQGFLPAADVELRFCLDKQGRTVTIESPHISFLRALSED